MHPTSQPHPADEFPLPPSHGGDPLRDALKQSDLFVAICDRQLRYRWVFNPLPGISAEAFIDHTDDEIFGVAGLKLTELKLQALRRGVPLEAAIELTLPDVALILTIQIIPQGDPIKQFLCIGRPQALPIISPVQIESQSITHQEVTGGHDSINLLDLIDQVVVMTVDGGKLVYANQAARQLYGVDSGAMQGQRIDSTTWEIDQQLLHAITLQVQRGEVWQGEATVRSAEGRRRDVLLTCRPIMAGSGNMRAVLTDAVDIGKLKEAEAELRQVNRLLAELNRDLRHSRNLLHTLFNGIEDALCLLDARGNVLALNQRAAALLDLPDHQVPGYTIPAADATSPYSLAAFIRQGLQEQRIQRRRIQRSQDERRQILDVQTIPQFDDNGVLMQLVLHAHDVTEQVLIEAQMIEHERFAANGRLAATLAHEINTPLQAIENCLHLIGRVSDDRRERYLSLARDEIRRIGEIVQRLLNHYQPSSPEPTPVMLNHLIERVLMLTGASLSRQHIRVEQALCIDLPPVLGRADELTQVLLNLVMNAAHAMPRGGILRLETHKSANEPEIVTLAVIDNGVGIPLEDQSRIFEPYFTTRNSGNGLGLAVCQRIVTSHGGQLRVESSLGNGSRFTVALPIIDP